MQIAILEAGKKREQKAEEIIGVNKPFITKEMLD
jgi:hypothetical protein